MPKWEYMVLCPDSDAGYAVMLRDVGEEGWEAACAWSKDGTTHILYKRPEHVHKFEGDPVATCECGMMIVPSDWEIIGPKAR